MDKNHTSVAENSIAFYVWPISWLMGQVIFYGKEYLEESIEIIYFNFLSLSRRRKESGKLI